MQKTKTSIKEYLSSLPDDRRDDIKKLHELISKVLPEVKPVLWEGVFWGGSEQRIIGYGDLSYIRSDKKEVHWFKVGLALQKNYITVFLSPAPSKEYITDKYKKELGKAKVGKSTISFKNLEEIEIKVLGEVVKKAYALLKK